MKVTIDDNVCQKYNMSLPEVLMGLAVRSCSKDTIKEMLRKEILVKVIDLKEEDTYQITQRWSDVIDEIICDSSGSNNEERLLKLALKIMDCFPKQRMLDSRGRPTPYFFRCNKNEIKSKLKKFFIRYGDYTDEEIIDATKRYVAEYAKSDYRGMRLAKYFIWKDAKKINENGEAQVETVSDLATYLENKGGEEEVNTSDDWLLSARN